jgi:hypothetical protein
MASAAPRSDGQRYEQRVAQAGATSGANGRAGWAPGGSSVVNAIGPRIRFHGHDVVAADDRWPYGVAGIRGIRQRRGTGSGQPGIRARARESAPGEPLVGPANGVMLDASAEGWLHG